MSHFDTSDSPAKNQKFLFNRNPGSLRLVWLLSYPIILANMSESLLGVVDTYMVSQLGVIEIGAVGLGAMLALSLIHI